MRGVERSDISAIVYRLWRFGDGMPCKNTGAMPRIIISVEKNMYKKFSFLFLLFGARVTVNEPVVRSLGLKLDGAALADRLHRLETLP